jgi:hypothetical protein
MPIAPLPQNKSKNLAPRTRAPITLNKFSFALSDVGRVSKPAGATRTVRRATPEITRKKIAPFVRSYDYRQKIHIKQYFLFGFYLGLRPKPHELLKKLDQNFNIANPY